MRTQNPLVISSFARLAKANEWRLITPLQRRVPRDVAEVVRHKFGATALVLRGAYGRCLTGTPIAPRTKLTGEIMSLLDPGRGDACLLVAARAGTPRPERAPATRAVPTSTSPGQGDCRETEWRP